MKLDEELVHLFKRRCGVGMDISFLRPKDSTVRNAALTTTGAVSFMNRFSKTTEEVALNGRRAALMLTMEITHPEIEDFINIKQDLSKVTGANISVKVTDEFMEAVRDDKEFELFFNYNDGTKFTKLVNTKKIWKAFIKASTNTAEPGLLYWSKIKSESPSDGYEGYELQGVNPCSELTLSKSESCRLASINLASFIENPFKEDAYFNFEKFKDIIFKSNTLMDDIVDLELEKIDQILNKIETDPEDFSSKYREIDLWKHIREKAIGGRRTGLGITGLADCVAMLNLIYGKLETTEVIENIFKILAEETARASIKLAELRGSFIGWDIEKDKKSEYIKRVYYNLIDKNLFADYIKYGRRNIGSLTIAPNGSLSLMAQTSSGIEPVFMLNYKRRKRANPEETPDFIDDQGNKWKEFTVFHHGFKQWFKINYPDLDINILSDIELNSYIKKSPYYKASSHEIDYVEKIRMQGLINQWIDHSISMTVNLPKNITEEEVSNLYFKGWEYGLKGMTIYRDGSRSGVLTSGKEETNTEFKEHDAPKRPKTLQADYYIAKADGKEFAVIIGKWSNTEKPYEIFAFENPPASKNTKGIITKIKKGHYKFINGEFEIDNIQLAAERIEERILTLTASMLLRHGAAVNHVINVIKKIDDNVTSFSSVVRRYLSRYAVDEEITSDVCPECGEKLVREAGCVHCIAETCGYSKC